MILVTIGNINQYPELNAFINSDNHEEQKSLAQTLEGSYKIKISWSNPDHVIGRSILRKIISEPDGSWMSPYSIVSILGRKDLFDILLNIKLDEDDIDELFHNGLPNAALGGNLQIINSIIDILKNRIDLPLYITNSKWVIQQSLAYAAFNGHLTCVQHILSLEIADIDITSLLFDGIDELVGGEIIDSSLIIMKALIARNNPQFTHNLNCFLAIPTVRWRLYRAYIEDNDPSYLLKDSLRLGNQSASELLLNDQIRYMLGQGELSKKEMMHGLSMDFKMMTLDNRSLETLILVLRQKQHPLGLNLKLRQTNGTDLQRYEIEKLCRAPLINMIVACTMIERKHNKFHDFSLLSHIFSFLLPKKIDGRLAPFRVVIPRQVSLTQQSIFSVKAENNDDKPSNSSSESKPSI